MRQRLASCSATGRRPRNEDAVLVLRLAGGACALAVADGMGGQKSGHLASRLAIEAFAASLRTAVVGSGPQARLEAAFAAAAERVAAAAKEPGHEGMGTTLVAALLAEGELWIAHAGDSQALLVLPDDIRLLTRPHTVVEAEIAEGRITEVEALAHPFRHALVRALGEEGVVPEVRRVEPELWQRPGGAILLLGSDGLLNHLGPAEIQGILGERPGLEPAIRRLVLGALENGSDDNASVAALELGDFPRRSSGLGRAAGLAALVVLGLVAVLGLGWAATRLAATAPREKQPLGEQGAEPPRAAAQAAPAAEGGAPGADASTGEERFRLKRDRIAAAEAASAEALRERAAAQKEPPARAAAARNIAASSQKETPAGGPEARAGVAPALLTAPRPAPLAASAAPPPDALPGVPESAAAPLAENPGGEGVQTPERAPAAAAPNPPAGAPTTPSAFAREPTPPAPVAPVPGSAPRFEPPRLLNAEVLEPTGDGKEGTVEVEATVNERGMVTRVKLRETGPDPAARRANKTAIARALARVRATARFAPATRDGAPVAARVILSVHYSEAADGP